MQAEQLRQRQAPLKEKYRQQPQAACVTFRSVGSLEQSNLACDLQAYQGTVRSALHPAAGGTTESACSGDLLLDALVACAGVTVNAVATAMNIEIRSGQVTAEADFDFRGTLGVDPDVPVGLTDVRLAFELDTDADESRLKKLIELTERFCVIYQTLQHSPRIETSLEIQRS